MTPRASRLLATLAAVALLAPHGAGGLSAPFATEGVERVGRVLLPRLPGPVSIRVHALESLVHVDAPRAVPALVRALRLSPLAVCPDLDETVSGVTLHCRSRRATSPRPRSRWSRRRSTSRPCCAASRTPTSTPP